MEMAKFDNLLMALDVDFVGIFHLSLLFDSVQ
jgi:hypothetical protein